MELKTPLYEEHVKLGGKIVPFGGYLLPVQYGPGLIKEHMAVRERAGLFDVSHMGEILCEGPDALENLNRILTNKFDSMKDGQCRYSPMCNMRGGTIDDLIVYKEKDDHYFIVVNAANKEKDFIWMRNQAFGDVTFEDVSDKYAQIALQGPKAMEIIKKLCDPAEIPEKYYHANFHATVAGIPCIMSTTGYTGESGVEIYYPAEKAAELWNKVLEAGEEEGILPCGLGARDTLRMEAGMPLYGHEMTEDISPLEAGLKFAVKMDKEDFIGKKGLERRGEPKMKRVGLEVTGRGIVREEQEIFLGDEKIGFTTSGTKGPFINKAVAMAMVPVEHAEIGTKLQVNVRGRMVDVEICKIPFYKAK